MSLSVFFAEAMLYTEKYLEKYKERLTELDKQGLPPRLDLKLKYKVYLKRGSEFGVHKSIVLTTDDKHFLTIELLFIVVDGKKRIYPIIRSLDKSAIAKMEYLGEIEETGQELIGKAVAVIKQFGSYFKLCNNCQDFCNMYTEAIGLEHAQELTDRDKLEKAVLLGGAITIAAFLFAVMR